MPPRPLLQRRCDARSAGAQPLRVGNLEHRLFESESEVRSCGSRCHLRERIPCVLPSDLSLSGRDTAPLFLVDLRSQYKSQAAGVARDITTMFPQYNFGENSLTLGELLSLVNGTINRIFALILLILYFALLIASLGIGATMIMRVSDRRREIGLLRSQGVSRLQVTGLFLGEGTFLGFFGFLLAVPGGLLLLKGATNSTSLAGFFIPFIIPYGAIVQALILALAAVLTGSLYPAVRASRLEITRALEQV